MLWTLDAFLLAAASLMLTVALVLQNVTLANGRYGLVWLAGLVLGVAAGVCLVVAASRGDKVVRAVAILLMLLTLYVVVVAVRGLPEVLYPG